MKLTREEALKRVTELHHNGTAPSLHCKTQDLVDLLLSVQAETELRVADKCCEISLICPSLFEKIGFPEYMSVRKRLADLIEIKIREAFPQ